MTLSKPTCPPKAPPPNTITLGLRASTYEFGRGHHKWSIRNSIRYIRDGCSCDL